ncbi:MULTISPECIES: hypothetical protein [unclassified Bacillus (in: firmicutes)]|nr:MULTISPECIES: hypothetical protein [unclassified Bacillus (in: firmicutes)]SFA87937.1 hypothetical protein SAMN02799634_102278 [Bacillus sp. UNCCL13]SFQ84461.1 hypothetical protein SAMN04488577_2396 [Bacillus sp. cl95]
MNQMDGFQDIDHLLDCTRDLAEDAPLYLNPVIQIDFLLDHKIEL